MNRIITIILLSACTFILVTACSTPTEIAPTQTAPTAQIAQLATSTNTNTNTPEPSPTPTTTQSPTPSLTPTQTASATPSATATPTTTATQTIAEKLKTHIVFFLILPELGRTDVCGNISAEPIISQRYRTGDKIQDVQIALNMLFSVGRQRYNIYYNALWNTRLTINSFEYDSEKDSAVIDFGGWLPTDQITLCEKHAIREQIWKTFYFYQFKEKIFTINGKFLIDQLSRK